MIKDELKKQVIRISKKLYERQLVNANEGNVSVRDGELIYITPSQVCKELLTPEMIVVTDLEGNQIDGRLKPSSEIKLHLHLYKLRADIGGVVHDHSPFATAYAIARKPIESKAYTEMIYFYDKIPVVDYGAPGTDKIFEGIGKYAHQTDVMLLANHGLAAVGTDAYDAYLKAEAVETLAKTLTITRLIGGEYPVSPNELDELYEMRKKKLGRDRVK
jgi:L-fuculose-phosphate aldolase